MLTDKPTIIEAIRNPDLFDSLFKTQSTWVASIVWLKAVFGLDMAPGEQPTKFELVIDLKTAKPYKPHLGAYARNGTGYAPDYF